MFPRRIKVLSLLLLITIGPYAPARATPETFLSVAPNSSMAAVGGIFRIGLNVTDATDLYWYRVTLTYNTNVLDVFNSTLQGTMFNASGRPYDVIPCCEPQINDQEGSVTVELRIRGTTQGVNGTGSLIFISFLVSFIGTSPLDIDETVSFLIDSSLAQGSVIFQTQDGTFTSQEANNIIRNGSFELGVLPPQTDPKIKYVDSGAALEDTDPRLRYVDSNGNDVRDTAEPVIYDSNNNQAFDTGEPVFLGSTPANGTPLKDSPKLKYEDKNGNNLRETDEPIVYDNNNDNSFDSGEPVAGGIPTGNDRRDVAESVVYDADNDGLYDAGEPVLVHPAHGGIGPASQTPLKTENRLKFFDNNNDGVWTVNASPRETVVYDSNNNDQYDSGEEVVTKVVTGWRFESFEGVESGTLSLDSTRAKDGVYSATVNAGPMVCEPTPCPTRITGFTQFSQSLPSGTTFANVTDSPTSISFWFYLEPFGTASDNRVRYVDEDADGTYDLGEVLVWDANSDGIVHETDWVVSNTTIRRPDLALLGRSVLGDIRVRFIDSPPFDGQYSAETVVYDTDLPGDNRYNAGDVLIYGPAPALGASLTEDPRVRFYDANGDGSWSSGLDPVIYDSNSDGDYDFGEPLVSGIAPGVGAPLTDDPLVKFYDANANDVRDLRGETLVFDSNGDRLADSGDMVVSETPLHPPVADDIGKNLLDAMGDFRLRIFGAESIAELDYVFDPHPAVSYSNTTGTRNIISRGFEPGRWYYFARNLKSDWVAAGFPLTFTFSRIQFEGLIFQPPLRSIIFWLDDVKVLAGPVGNQPARVDFTITPSAPFRSEVVTFNASASFDPDGTIVTYSWDFGDLTPPITGAVTTHSYSQSGSFRVTLTVTDNEGQPNAVSKAVRVTEPPPCPRCPDAKMTFVPDHPIAGLTVTFDASSSADPNNLRLTYTWTTGDGTTKNGPTIEHTYATPGTYYVTLTVTNSENWSDSATGAITVSTTDVRLAQLSLVQQYVRRDDSTGQGVSGTLFNIGNMEVYSYAKVTVISERQGTSIEFTTTVQRLDVRAEYDFSLLVSTPQNEERILVIVTVYVSTLNLAAGDPGWRVATISGLAYRVFG